MPANQKADDVISWYVPGVVEIDLEKAERDSGGDVEATRPIKGWCSTESLDRHSEVVMAKGLNFDQFVRFGYFNDNHKQDTDRVLGEPDLAKLINNRWWTEGRLYKGHKYADSIWDLAKAMQKSGAKRRLGFSIEGKVRERDAANRILRADVRNVAITNCPVNTDCTWDAICKSFAPSSAIEDAVAHAAEVHRSSALTFEDAVSKIMFLRPHYSRDTAARIVRFAKTQ